MVIKFPQRMKLIEDKTEPLKFIDMGGCLPLSFVSITGDFYKFNPELKLHELQS